MCAFMHNVFDDFTVISQWATLFLCYCGEFINIFSSKVGISKVVAFMKLHNYTRLSLP